MHSPVPVDDPSLDTVEVYSDWDYYSDDYFDDDPTIMKRRKTMVDLPPTTDDSLKDVIGKKPVSPKVAELSELSLGVPLIDIPTSTFKGVIWKDTYSEKGDSEYYQPGQGETVTLFEDWREAFDPSKHRDYWLSRMNAMNNRSPEAGGRGIGMQESDDYGSRYSPPPLAIDDTSKATQARTVEGHDADHMERRHWLRESALVDDTMANVAAMSESEATESTDVFETPMAVEEETPGSSAPAPSLEQEHDDRDADDTGPRQLQQFVCVEVPSPPKSEEPPPLLETETPARRKGRKPSNTTQPRIEGRTRKSRKDSVSESSDAGHPPAKRTTAYGETSTATATRTGHARKRSYSVQRADDAVPEEHVKPKRGHPRKRDSEPQVHCDGDNTSSRRSTKLAAAIDGQDPIETELDKRETGSTLPRRKRARKTKS